MGVSLNRHVTMKASTIPFIALSKRYDGNLDEVAIKAARRDKSLTALKPSLLRLRNWANWQRRSKQAIEAAEKWRLYLPYKRGWTKATNREMSHFANSPDLTELNLPEGFSTNHAVQWILLEAGWIPNYRPSPIMGIPSQRPPWRMKAMV